MKKYYRHSYFILVVVLLSIVLAGFMYATFNAEPTESFIQSEEVITIDAEEYKQSITQIIATFDEQMRSAQDDLDRLVATETALEDVLDLRVPVEHKDLHLDLAMVLNQMQATLKSEDRSIDEYLQTIETLKQETSWLVQ